MHDPMTVAFNIESLIVRATHWNPKHRETLVTIWHCDPEERGDEDSCGYAYVTLSPKNEAWATATASSEWKFWFGTEYRRINFANADDFAVLAAAWVECRLHVLGLHRAVPLSARDVGGILGMMTSSGDNFHHLVIDCRKPDAGRGTENMDDLLAKVLRIYLTRRRPWYRHPRWHVHHWRIQVHVWQRFNRYAFSRCNRCGGRFKWGESPCSGWSGAGPRFLKGEPNVWHRACDMQPPFPVATGKGYQAEDGRDG